MRVNILFFGPARDWAQTDATTIELPERATLTILRATLTTIYPQLARAMDTVRLAVNETFSDGETILSDGDTVAIIPPVSGGSGGETILVELATGPIDVEHVRRFVLGDVHLGGICTFEGATRTETSAEHGPLVRLEYETIEPMARKQLHKLAYDATERYAAGRVAIVHRLGAVPPGQVSVMIAVACEHRAESFEACRFLIDALKKDVPIWKKDVFEDGFVSWVEPAN